MLPPNWPRDMTALHFRARLVEARLCHLLARFPLFQIQFPSPLPLFGSRLWTKQARLVYAADPLLPSLTLDSPKRRMCVFVCVPQRCVRHLMARWSRSDIVPLLQITVIYLIEEKQSDVERLVNNPLNVCLHVSCSKSRAASQSAHMYLQHMCHTNDLFKFTS